jgi:hypothetical protein
MRYYYLVADGHYVPSGDAELNGPRPFPGKLLVPSSSPQRIYLGAGWTCCRCGHDENFDAEFPADSWTCRFCGESACSTCSKLAVAAT